MRKADTVEAGVLAFVKFGIQTLIYLMDEGKSIPIFYC
jgi:hypothetical protein